MKICIPIIVLFCAAVAFGGINDANKATQQAAQTAAQIAAQQAADRARLLSAVQPDGNVATATALASAPRQCVAPSFPRGIDVFGNASSCSVPAGAMVLTGAVTGMGTGSLETTLTGIITPIVVTLAPGGTYTFTTVTSSLWGRIIVGANVNNADFNMDGSGNVQITSMDSSGLIQSNSNLSGHLCIGSSVAANPVVLYNRTPGSLTVLITGFYQ